MSPVIPHSMLVAARRRGLTDIEDAMVVGMQDPHQNMLCNVIGSEKA